MKTIIIDDEPYALTLLHEELKKIPFLKVVATFGSPIMAISYLQSNTVDLVFSDISMPDISGLQLIKSTNSKAMFILATAHRDHAIEGFELDVVDYLVKPYGFERLFKAVLKAQGRWLLIQNKPDKTTNHFELLSESPQINPYLFVKSDYKEVKILISQINYVSALKDYVKIFLEGTDKAIVTQMNLKAVEELLPPEKFCRVHRSFIVNIEKVNAHTKSELYINQVEIPIGDLYRNHFLMRLKG
jgi:DNA-binding LytR/AlgR family response regulator